MNSYLRGFIQGTVRFGFIIFILASELLFFTRRMQESVLYTWDFFFCLSVFNYEAMAQIIGLTVLFID